ncbi:hypothetical protein BGZ73_002194, partial [Actinomortierella ambigua]
MQTQLRAQQLEMNKIKDTNATLLHKVNTLETKIDMLLQKLTTPNETRANIERVISDKQKEKEIKTRGAEDEAEGEPAPKMAKREKIESN